MYPMTISLSKTPSNNTKHKYIIFFIPGNPGVIEYYRIFLTHLHALLSSQDFEIHITGESLAGFECGSNPPRLLEDERLPFGVEEQICFVEKMLMDHVEKINIQSDDGSICNVILVGHSFGSYVLLELIRRFREGLRGSDNGDGRPRMRISGGICLFPGILDLAESPRVKEIMSIPYIVPLIQTASLLLRWLTYLLPISILSLLLGKLADLPENAASTTAYFLQSRWGLQQALHMAQDELRVIANNKWDNEIWGATSPSPLSQPRSHLYFLFGKNDYWMADQIRDDLIEKKGRLFGANGGEMWKPVMEIEDTGIPHDFCIRHGVAVAERVVPWVSRIMNQFSSS